MRGLIMELGFVLVMALATGQRAEAADATRIAGAWSSDYGPVIFNVSPTGGISGFWNQEKGQGQISSGLFDGRNLTFSYYQPWNHAHGTALLRLLPNGLTLTGRWSQQDGEGNETDGDWTLSRD